MYINEAVDNNTVPVRTSESLDVGPVKLSRVDVIASRISLSIGEEIIPGFAIGENETECPM